MATVRDDGAAEWLSPQALARMLDVSLRHIWRLRDSGDLPAPVRLGRLVRWRRSAVERFLEEHAEKAGR
jgi:excisionase family DNA binding protein